MIDLKKALQPKDVDINLKAMRNWLEIMSRHFGPDTPADSIFYWELENEIPVDYLDIHVDSNGNMMTHEQVEQLDYARP